MWGRRNGLRVLGAQWWLRGSLTCRRRIWNKPCCVSKSLEVPDHHPCWPEAGSSNDGTSSPEGHWMPTRLSFKQLAAATSPEQDSGGGLVWERRRGGAPART